MRQLVDECQEVAATYARLGQWAPATFRGGHATAETRAKRREGRALLRAMLRLLGEIED